jgi:1A family penicillin-binding protein
VQARPATRRAARASQKGCALRTLMVALGVSMLAAILLSLVGAAAAAVGYMSIAGQLPSPDELRQRAASFQSTFIYDRNGELLYELIDPQGGRRVNVPLDQIAPLLVQATVATEDKHFYQHPGFDVVAIGRALYQNLREGETVSGASTITQQLARMLLLSDDERAQRSASRKIKEIVLAAELTRRYGKDEIIEIYLNEVYYGNLAYGIQAASQTYFQKDAKDLTLAEASLLAGLPQAPAVYDPFTNPDMVLQRQKQVLALMVENGYIGQDEADVAAGEMNQRIRNLQSPVSNLSMRAPHFVNYVRQVLEDRYGAQAVYRGGFKVTTTLDPRLQALGEELVRTHVAQLAGRHVTNGALVAMDPVTGEILAMVGSKDFNDGQIGGQVNVAARLRQPGSAIKPITYLTAFEMGWTPSTLIWDLPTEFPGFPEPYKPVNYDGQFHGPTLLRAALANSYNIPAVKALQFTGIGNMQAMAARMGITTLTRPDYGLSLTLGGGEVTLVELTGAYAVLANQGKRAPPTPILEITRGDGQVLWRNAAQGPQVIRPEHAYLMTSILSDNAARTPAFGENSPLRLNRPAAAKTGTTNDFRDNWTVGYTPDLVVGVWVGNNDNTPMQGVSGIVGAAPLWHDFMERALEGRPSQDFTVPPGLIEVEVCADSGAQPSACPDRRKELFAADQKPLGPEYDWWRDCSGQRVIALNVVPEDGRNWLRQWAAERGIPVVDNPDCSAAPDPQEQGGDQNNDKGKGKGNDNGKGKGKGNDKDDD